jgi:hypothetical protein
MHFYASGLNSVERRKNPGARMSSALRDSILTHISK